MSGSLLRAEVHRFRSRRFIVVLLLLAVAVFGVGVAIASLQFAKPSPEGLAQARTNIAQLVQEQEQGRQQCLQNLPPNENPESFCGSPLTAADLQPADYLDKKAFDLAEAAPAGAVGIGIATAALLFLVGATWIGAEWSTRSIVALLFWEPRRTKVVTTKLGVLLAAAVAVAVLAQVLWLAAAELLAATEGTSDLPDGFYGDLLAVEGRAVLLGVLVASLGFALASLVRNTGAALGIAFFYFVVAENAVRVLRPHWQEWLLSTNAGALLTEGGLRYYQDGTYVDDKGVLQTGREVLVSNLHGALVMGGTAAALVAVGIVLFKRRDLH